jgi:AhpD family alkylhydroperoxidase
MCGLLGRRGTYSRPITSLTVFSPIFMSQVTEFNEYRQRMNEKILTADNKVIKRFFNLDTNTYQAGALDVKTKEMLGLACSMALRCDDCIKYHLGKCHEEGLTDEEIYEVFAIANLIGGSIVIPHFRRAVEYWEALKEEAAAAAPEHSHEA